MKRICWALCYAIFLCCAASVQSRSHPHNADIGLKEELRDDFTIHSPQSTNKRQEDKNLRFRLLNGNLNEVYKSGDYNDEKLPENDVGDSSSVEPPTNDDKKIEKKNCIEQCGDLTNVRCGGDLKTIEGIICECDDVKLHYVSKSEGCKETCQRDQDCENEAKCGKKDNEDTVKFCDCPPELEGDRCEKVKECDTEKFKNCKDGKGTCKFDAGKKEAYCRCFDHQHPDTTLNNCKDNDCESHQGCENGGICEKFNCKCLEKTSGRKCETIDCSDLAATCTSSGGSCGYDINKVTPYCSCPYPLVYMSGTKKCEEKNCTTDEDCGNGGACVNWNCTCLEKTSGLKCETIDCSDLEETCTSSGGNCSYNTEKKTPYCLCPEGKVYKSEAKKCEDKNCTTHEDCKHDGTCDKNWNCKCLAKTYGPKCEYIDCSDLGETCTSSGGSCSYDAEKKTPFCLCPNEKIYKSDTKKCEVPCVGNPCRNGGICKIIGSVPTCFCTKSFSGDFCERRTGGAEYYIIAIAACIGFCIFLIICLIYQRMKFTKR